ncbi:MAG: hypothetical protein IPH13_00640 [Planctomycetes bacterium]|nr:hypothetical protein [Planctomycetota bacterium]
MPRDLLEYHALEDGELNRLWYEEQDPRARDAFQLRWWLGGDPIGGKDLLSNYHSLILHRCFEAGLLLESQAVEVVKLAIPPLVANFPGDAIARFEDVLMPHVTKAIAAVRAATPSMLEPSGAEFRARVEQALASGAGGKTVHDWINHGAEDRSDSDWSTALDALRAALPAIYGPAAATQHPLAVTEVPKKKAVDASVTTQHLTARQIFNWAQRSGDVTATEKKEIEWCRPCRELCQGALLFLRDVRKSFGGTLPDLPQVSPQLDADLAAAFQAVAPEVPKPVATKSTGGGGGGGKGMWIVFALLAVAVAAAAFFMNR